MAYLIGIDLGTSGTKTVLFDQEGHVVASATVEYPMYQEHNGWAEQDPLDLSLIHIYPKPQQQPHFYKKIKTFPLRKS